MEIAMGAIGPLLLKLGELHFGELTLDKEVRKGIKSLLVEFTSMHAALRMVARLPVDQLDEGVKIWAGNVKDLSYHVEEIIDVFMVRVEDGDEPTNPKNGVQKILKRVKRLFKNGNQISDALEEAVHEAKKLAELQQRYWQEMGRYGQEMRDTGVGASVDPRLVAMYTDVSELVGIEETRDKLINMLIDGDDWSKHPLKTISIVGFGGLGKTTLAKAAYDKIKVQFDCHAFVSVSQNPELKKVLMDILFELDTVKDVHIYNVRDERDLIGDIIEFLNDKRYLIVIDDIWDKEVWNLIQCAFSKKSLGSRLITTTRIISVSEACCSSGDDIYRMQPLSHDVSRALFCRRVFSHEEGCPQELLQVSENILKKCGGVPLAIITIASRLGNNHQMKTKDQWYALLRSIGHVLTEDPCSLEEIKKILLFSYYDLPSCLKPCLLYLSIFPEDREIRRERLIWRWISEGIVYSENIETSLYKLGNSYFNELVNRRMIQPIGIDSAGNIEACRVHDMVLDLISSLSSEENFVTILDDAGREMPNSEISKVRRLSIQSSKIDVDTTRMEHMRSLTIFTSNVAGKVLDISSFQVLRVLDLEGCVVSDVGYVRNLLHLRYLGLKKTCVEDLPMEIGKLQFLLTLDLRGTKIKVLPSSIVQLRRLMCLYVDNDMKLPSLIGNLACLEVLCYMRVFDKDVDVLKELGRLTKLRILQIDCSDFDGTESMDKTLEESIGNMYKLNCIYIYVRGRINLMKEGWVPPSQLSTLVFMSSNCWFETLPSWINPSSLYHLSYLYISVAEVRSEDIQLLGMLPSLRDLRVMDYYKYKGAQHLVEMPALCSGALFPYATKCRFICIGAVPFMFPRGAAQRLKHLKFALSAKWISRENIDLGMRHLPSLEQVYVKVSKEGASYAEVDEAKAALRAAAEDHPNHPVLTIYDD